MSIIFNARTNSITTDASSVDFDQPITTPASTTTLAGLNIAEAVAAPSAPVDGDVWVTAAGEFFARLNGVSTDLAAGGSGDVSKVGTPVDNEIGVWTGDGTIEGDTNFTWNGTSLTVAGQYVASNGNGPTIRNESTSDTNPVLIPRQGDLDTGIGSAADDRLALISGGQYGMIFVEVSSGVIHAFSVDLAVTAFAGGGIGSATELLESYNVVTTVATTGDSVRLPISNLIGSVVYIKNNGANACDVFPASGDDLGQGTSTAESLPAGQSVAYMLTVANTTWTKLIDGMAGGGGGNVSNTGTPVNNQLAIWTDATTIEGDANVTYTGSSFAAYGDGTAPDNHYFGLDTSNRIRFESGANYTVIHHEDDNVSTETRNMYHNIQSSATGAGTFWWRLNGGDVVQWDVSEGRFIFAGAIEFTEQSDHATTLNSGRTQVWAKSRTLDPELMVSTGDSNNDHTLTNVIEVCYHFSQTTTAADPGAGIMRWNNATPASVTNWYVDDLESTGRDASYMLSNLADGDIITMRNQVDGADYMVASVNGTPTDNTGYWTIPVTVIHAGTRPSTGDPVHLIVDWIKPLQNNVYARKSTGTQTVSSTTFTTATNYSGISLDAGVYLCSGQFRVNRNNTSNNVQIRWTSSTYRTSSPSTDMDSARTRVLFTYTDSGGTATFVQMVGDTTSAAALNLSTNASTSWVQVEGVFTVNSATTLDWEIRTSNVATSIRMEDGGVIKFTKIDGSTTTTSGTYLS